MNAFRELLRMLNQLQHLLKRSLAEIAGFKKPVVHELTEMELYGVSLDVSSISTVVKRSIYNGVYEKAEVEMCKAIVTTEDRILELGGAIGFVGIYCQKMLGVIDYYTVEANPECLNLLKRNYALNGLEPRFLEAAFGPVRGEIDFYIHNDFWESSAIVQNGNSVKKKITAMGLPLLEILNVMPFVCSTMIVDIEGGERFMSPCDIPKHIKKLVIELHPQMSGISEMFNYLAQLNKAGFEVVDYISTTYALVRP